MNVIDSIIAQVIIYIHVLSLVHNFLRSTINMEMKRPSIFSIATENDMISDIELMESRKILSSVMSKIQDDEDQKEHKKKRFH